MIGHEDTANTTPTPEAKKGLLALAEHRPQAWARSIAARKGKPLTEDHKDALSVSHRRTHAERMPAREVPRWMIAEDALLGLSSIASAKKRNGHQPDVARVRKAMAIPGGWPAAYRHGEALGWKHFGDFCADFGHTKTEWAPLINVSLRSFANRVKKKGDRPFSSPKPKDETVSHPGRALNAKWDALIEQFCYTQGKRWRVRDFLVSELRDIPAKHAALMTAFGILGTELRGEVRQSDTQVRIERDVDSMSEWICWKAIYEPPMQVLVRFLLPLRDLLSEKPGLLAPGTFRSEALADELLARSYKATPGRIEEAVAGKLQPLHPSTLSKLTSITRSEPATPASAKSRKSYKHAPSWQPKAKLFRAEVRATLPTFRKLFEELRKAKRATPLDSAAWKTHLGQQKHSNVEIDAALQSKTYEAAAVRQGLKLKTAQNLYYSGSSKAKSPKL